MKPSAVIIENDLFDIAARLREIDSGYFVVYDRVSHAYEVHNALQRGDTFALKVPYRSLDVRTVDLVRRTRAENAKRLIEEMERENRKLEESERRKAIERAAAKAGL